MFSNKDIIERARAGDKEAWAILVRRLEPLILRFLWSHCPKSEVYDLVQETYLKVWKGLYDVDPTTINGWVVEIAKHIVSDYFRRQGAAKRRPTENVTYNIELMLQFDHGDIGDRSLRALQKHLLEEMRKDGFTFLSPRKREIIVATVFGKCDANELAVSLGCSRSSVDSNKSQALRDVRIRLNEQLESALRKRQSTGGNLPSGVASTNLNPSKVP